jgi:cytochrome P450
VLELIVKSSRAQGDEYDDKALRDQLLTLFFAGHETSSTSLTWLHYLIWKHADVRERLCAEVADVLGGRLPTADDLGRLEYTERVINETLRLYSPIHSISRVALEDDVLGGYRIPAGTMLYVSLYATHRLAAHWPDPDRFDPDRFLPERMAKRPRFAFIPFAAGHRNCVGASMAMVELKLSVAQIAQRFVLDLAPGHRVEMAAGTTMHPRYGMQMTIRPA